MERETRRERLLATRQREAKLRKKSRAMPPPGGEGGGEPVDPVRAAEEAYWRIVKEVSDQCKIVKEVSDQWKIFGRTGKRMIFGRSGGKEEEDIWKKEEDIWKIRKEVSNQCFLSERTRRFTGGSSRRLVISGRYLEDQEEKKRKIFGRYFEDQERG